MVPAKELFADCYEWTMKWHLEIILDEGFLRITRVGGWLHAQDAETGEGQWEWAPEAQAALPRSASSEQPERCFDGSCAAQAV
jgi:hypothetical protein